MNKRPTPAQVRRAIEKMWKISDHEFEAVMDRQHKEERKRIRVIDLIEARKFAKARAIYENNRDWMFIPDSVMRVLYHGFYAEADAT